MTEITREQLELAALAIGGTFSPGTERVRTGETWDEWEWRGAEGVCVGGIVTHPHTDIGGAAQLAVKLGMWVNRGMASAVVNGEPVEVVIEHDGTEADMERAYCHAITLCAAEIGLKMKEAK